MIDRRNVSNLYPLTALQEGMLYHALRDPQSRAYFERLEFGLDGALDATAFAAAWQDLTERHDILRTVFVVRNTPQPLQVVLRQWPVRLHHADLSALPASAARAEIDAWKAADLAQGFDLTREVPLRLALFRLAPEQHRVVWSFHHILLDGWCLAILQHEFEVCYLARLAGHAPVLPPAPPYVAYVRWLTARQASEQAHSAEFWNGLLADFAVPTPLPARLSARLSTPFSLPGNAAQAPDLQVHQQALSAAAQSGLEQTARQLGVTPNSVVQALWGLLLAAGQGCCDAVFAATVAGRPAELPGAEATVGLFINAIPVRVRFAPQETLAELIRRVHEQGIAARPHHATPLPEIQAAHPLRERLLDHVLVFENYPQQASAADPRLPRVNDDALDLHEYTHYGFEFQFLPAAPAKPGASRDTERGTERSTERDTEPGKHPAENPASLRWRFDRQRYAAGQIADLGRVFDALLASAADSQIDACLTRLLPGWRGPQALALAASFTAEPLVEAMRDWLHQFAQPGQPVLCPYNQCPQALLDPDSALATAELAFLLYRVDDACRDLPPGAAAGSAAETLRAIAQLEARQQALQAAFAHWLQQAGRPPLLVALLPADPQPASAAAALTATLERLRREWAGCVRQAAAAHPGRIGLIELDDPAQLQAQSGLPAAAWPDQEALRLGHLPYSEAACAVLGAQLARPVLARARAPFKVLAVDCDNTLWQGICGEAGPLGVRIGPAQAALQDYLLARQEEGFLLALVSKNVPADVWAVFEQHPDMRLRREHIAASAINWEAKSGNLQALARELNLGSDSFIFIDDNPAEIAEVQHHCPEVLALPLPADLDRLAEWLPLLWAGDVASVTSEDRERTRMMQAEATRKEIQAQTRNLDEFLAGIGLELAIGPMAPHQLARVAQLTQRTNQFNLSGRRRDEAEMAALAAPDRHDDTAVLAVEVADRFGAYGLTGVVIACRVPGHDASHAAQQGGTLVIDSFMLSCRVLGRRVEQGILCALGALARRWGCPRIDAPLVVTARNEPIRSFLAGAPWQVQDSAPGLYFCSTEQACAAVPGIRLQLDHVFAPAATPAPRQAMLASPAQPSPPGDPTPTPTSIPLPLPLPIDLADADTLRHARHYLSWLAAAAGWPWQIPAALRSRPPQGAAMHANHANHSGRRAQGATELGLAALWAEVLQPPGGAGQLPAEVAFADLGGHSLHAVRLVARIARQFGCELGLADFYRHDRIATLAAWLDQHRAVHVDWPSIPPAPAAADYPLSHSQHRIWLLSRLGTAAAAYNQCAAFVLRGRLDPDGLQRAITAVVRRHEILRSVFPLLASDAAGDAANNDASPRQRILADPAIVLQRVPLAQLQHERLAQRIAAEARQPFDLENGPLLRFTLYQSEAADASDEAVLAIALHHIIGDGWSFGLLLNDLAAAYPDGQLPAPPALRYRDYAVWSRSAAYAKAMAPHQHYWRQRFSAAASVDSADSADSARSTPRLPGIVSIPSDWPRPPVASGRGGSLRHRLALSPGQHARLAAQLDAHQVSLFQWLASLVMVLIARHGEAYAETEAETETEAATGEAAAAAGKRTALPVRIGTPVAGRDLAELEPLLGICVNTVVLDARIDLSQPFSALLAELRGTALAALDHQRYPFDQLVADLAPERDASRNPLFDVMVALQNAPRQSDGSAPGAAVNALAGLTVSDLPVPLGVSAFDLVFEFAAPPGEAWWLELSYASDLYSASTAERLARRLTTLLTATLADPQQTLAALPLVDAAEAARLAAFAQGPRLDRLPLPHDTLPGCFAAQAARYATRPALITDTETLDFASLAARSQTLASALAAAGVQPGDRVAVLLPRSSDWPVALLATLAAGASYLPLEARHPPGRWREILADAQPRLLLTTAALAGQLNQAASLDLAWLDPANLRDHQAQALARSAPLPGMAITADAEAYLLYTSGSTGQPKGVQVSHRAFLNMIAAQIAGFAVDTDDVVLQLASCAFDASLSEFFLGWLAGAPVALVDSATVGDSARLGQFIARHRVSLATFTPSYLQQLEDDDLASLRRVIVAGEAVHGRDVARLLARGLVVYNAYGPTETAVCASLGRVIAAPADADPVAIGRPLNNLRIELCDPRDQPVPIGVPGELLIFGPGVALGYWQRPELNATRFIGANPDPGQVSDHSTTPSAWPKNRGRGYRSGDLARWRDNGEIEYLGRRDAQIQLRGLRVEPGEIAARLLAQPGVRQAVVDCSNGPAGKELVAWVACSALAEQLEQSEQSACSDAAALQATLQSTLQSALAASLPAHMVPSRWVFLPRLPLTPSGKLDRRQLPPLPAATALAGRGAPPALATALATTPSTSPTSAAAALARVILAQWQNLLGASLDADCDFFAAGGNSLTAMKAARRLSQHLGRPCPAIAVFRHPSAKRLAAALLDEDEYANTGETLDTTETTAPRRQSAGWQHWGAGVDKTTASAPAKRSSPAPSCATHWLVALPPAPGLAAVYAQLAAQLVARQPNWHISAVDYREQPLALQIEAWADQVQARMPTYLSREPEANRASGIGMGIGMAPVLFGHSGGGRLALALAATLTARGLPPRAVILADTWRWDENDPAHPELAGVLAELHRRAAADDRALAAATGLQVDGSTADGGAAALIRRGQAYRRMLASLPTPAGLLLPLPVWHLQAAVAAEQIPAGFGRDWQDCSSCGYHTLTLVGGHNALLSGPALPDNAARMAQVLGELEHRAPADPAPCPPPDLNLRKLP